jgi:hypothetical protein
VAVEYDTTMQPTEFSLTVARSEWTRVLCGPRAAPTNASKQGEAAIALPTEIETEIGTEIETEVAHGERTIEIEVVKIEIRIAKATEATLRSPRQPPGATRTRAKPRARARRRRAGARAREAAVGKAAASEPGRPHFRPLSCQRCQLCTWPSFGI